MFSAFLLKKPLWPYIQSHLRKNAQWSLKESSRADFDLALPILGANAVLYVILIPVSDFESHKIDQPYPLLRSPPLPDRKLVVLVDRIFQSDDERSGMAMLSNLQKKQILDQTVAPFIFVSSPDQIAQHIDAYLESFQRDINLNICPVVDTVSIIASTTTSVPYQYLTNQEVRAVGRVYPSIRALEEAIRTEHGRVGLRQILNEQTVGNMVQFWKDEWIA